MKKKTIFRVRVATKQPTHKLMNFPRVKGRVRFRFGNSNEFLKFVPIEVNSVESIHNCANKMVMKDLFLENGVNTPNLVERGETPTSFPVVMKKRYRSKGDGMYLIESIEDWDNNYPENYYAECFFMASREYRVHVVGDKVIHIDVKRRKKDEVIEDNWIKNHETGYRFWERTEDRIPDFEQLSTLCVKAIKSLGLEFGCCDVGYNIHDNIYTVYECNSAPGMRTIIADKYVKNLLDYIKTKHNIDSYV